MLARAALAAVVVLATACTTSGPRPETVLATGQAGPSALATGCTVVLKPSENGSLTPLRFGELCLEAGIPPGVVNVVTGHGGVGGPLAPASDGADH